MAEITSTVKTYTLGTDNTTYFEVITVTYDDESQDITKRRVGPAAALAGDQADKIKDGAAKLAAASYEVSYAKRTINEFTDIDASITSLTGVSPLKKLQDQMQAELLAAGWTIDQGTGFEPLVFTVNAQGGLRYSINGAATKAAVIYGQVLRLKNYPASPIDTDFYNVDGAKYYSLPNRGVVIKKP
jgi:hypothetical protein